MSEPPRLRASALRLRRFRRPLAFALAVGSAGGYADGYRSHAFVGSYGFVLRPHLVGEFRNVTCVPPHAARTKIVGQSATAPASSPRHTPTSSEYEKREAFPPPFGMSKCQTVKPSCTVFSVELSNALAASVTGR